MALDSEITTQLQTLLTQIQSQIDQCVAQSAQIDNIEAVFSKAGLTIDEEVQVKERAFNDLPKKADVEADKQKLQDAKNGLQKLLLVP